MCFLQIDLLSTYEELRVLVSHLQALWPLGPGTAALAALDERDYDALEARALLLRLEHHISCKAPDALETWAGATLEPVDDLL